MRLWSLHPKYLDPQGLVALWREALLARAVLCGQTRGYKHHPQLDRFRDHPSPHQAIDAYLAAIHAEASQRGYSFDKTKFEPTQRVPAIAVSTGQIQYEWAHLKSKLAQRSPQVFAQWREISEPACHPSFRIIPGPIALWERAVDVVPLTE